MRNTLQTGLQVVKWIVDINVFLTNTHALLYTECGKWNTWDAPILSIDQGWVVQVQSVLFMVSSAIGLKGMHL